MPSGTSVGYLIAMQKALAWLAVLGGVISAAAAGELSPNAASWVAPARAARQANPIVATADSIAVGKRVYAENCFSCHGAKGQGDGPTAQFLERRPGNLADPKLTEQTDGALFWKISEGRAPMPTFGQVLEEEERWQVIHYVRTLAAPPNLGDKR